MNYLTYCAEQVRQHDNDHFICSLYAPPAARAGLHALYAFNLEIARTLEAVREPILGQMRLQWWRERIETADTRQSAKHPVAASLAETISRFGLPLDPFYQLLNAREFDLTGRTFSDIPAVIDYTEATSATLSLLALQILRASPENSKKPADLPAEQKAVRDVGISWALTGLLRAIPFHAAAQRCYLPSDLCVEHGLKVENLNRYQRRDGLSDVVASIARIAQEHLAGARSVRREVSQIALPALLPATIASIYLRRLVSAQYNPYHASVQHSGLGRLALTAFQALCGRY